MKHEFHYLESWYSDLMGVCKDIEVGKANKVDVKTLERVMDEMSAKILIKWEER